MMAWGWYQPGMTMAPRQRPRSMRLRSSGGGQWWDAQGPGDHTVFITSLAGSRSWDRAGASLAVNLHAGVYNRSVLFRRTFSIC
jgi:hypothetical protein